MKRIAVLKSQKPWNPLVSQRARIFQIIGTEPPKESPKIPVAVTEYMTEERIHFFREIVGTEPIRGLFGRNSSLVTSDLFYLNQTLNLLKDLGYPRQEIADYCDVLGYPASLVLHRFGFFKELGTKYVPVRLLRGPLREPDHGKTIKQMKAILGLNPDAPLTETLLDPFGLPSDVFEQCVSAERNNFIRFIDFAGTVYRTFLCYRLQKKCGILEEEHDRLIRHSFYKEKLMSLKQTDRILDLMQKFEVPSIVIASRALRANPDSVEDLLSKFPTINGIDTVGLLRKNVVFWHLTRDRLEEILKILEANQIMPSVTNKMPKIYTAHPTRLRELLSEIDPEERPQMNISVKFLNLAIGQTKKNSDNVKTSNKPFIATAIEGWEEKRRNSSPSSLSIGVTALRYIGGMLDVSEPQMLKLLFIHPNAQETRFSNAQEVVSILLEMGFTKTQIVNGIHIIVYPREVVLREVMKLTMRPELQPFEKWKDNEKIFRFLLYFLEREYKFEGVAMFSDKDKEGQPDVREEDYLEEKTI